MIPPYSHYLVRHLQNRIIHTLHALGSTFTMCACGKRAKDCAVGLMTSFISWSVFGMDWSADLGLLVGIKGRFKWGQRVPFSGGLDL
jgi:hypothetical protein